MINTDTKVYLQTLGNMPRLGNKLFMTLITTHSRSIFCHINRSNVWFTVMQCLGLMRFWCLFVSKKVPNGVVIVLIAGLVWWWKQLAWFNFGTPQHRLASYSETNKHQNLMRLLCPMATSIQSLWHVNPIYSGYRRWCKLILKVIKAIYWFRKSKISVLLR